jgi:hypothetical protein
LGVGFIFVNFVIIIQGIKLTQAHSPLGMDAHHKGFVISDSLPAACPDKYKKIFLL